VKYAILTFGCRVNQADSLRIEEDLRARGAEPAAPDAADLVIVNSCTVTATADQGVRQSVRRVARTNPGARIVVTGCYGTRHPDEVTQLPNVLKVVPNDVKDDLVAAIAVEVGIDTASRFGGGDGPCGAPLEPGVGGRTALTLRVQTGCDERCAYCIIPLTRGRPRSLPPARILAEVERAARAGYRDVALAGVHLGSYGRDLDPPTSLEALMRALAAAPGDVSFRISSLEPMDCGPGILDLVSASDRFAPHFHLPLQHASDRMLGLMRRPYGLDDYRRLVDGIRDRLPHAAIGSDLIVGFPGETDDDFTINERYLSTSPLTHLHVFPYSDRPGTPAVGLPGHVPGAVVRSRALRLRQIGAQLASGFRRAQIGSVRPGLTLDDGSVVLTDNYLKVSIPPGRPRNLRVRVAIAGGAASLHGAVVS
jgi:threonylcarbamoyladenosine tRNA methylthiotransferase MtaB